MAPHIDTTYTANWHTSRDGLLIAAIVAHGTGGYDNDAGRRYLQRGGEKPDGSDRKVSIHCYISKNGTIYRMLPDDKGANHAGAMTAVLKVGTKTYRAGKINKVTLGFELANLQDGVDPYTGAQLNAMGWLIADWRRLFGPLPLYRHAEIDPTRRSDPVRLSVFAMEAHVPSPSTDDDDPTFVSPPPDPSLSRMSLFRVSGKGGARVFEKPHTSATKVRLVKHGVEVAGVIAEGQLYRGVKSWLHLVDDSGYIWRGSLAEVP